MKKLALILVLVCFIALLAGCGNYKNKIQMPPEPTAGNDGKVTILLDAGHGFRDVGCTSDHLEGKYEYELTMEFVNSLYGKLSDKGFEVLLTHDGISYTSEEDIISRAEKYGIEFDADKFNVGNNNFEAYERAIYSSVLDAEVEIDLMLSIHVNANANTDSVMGFEIDYCAENESSPMTAFAFDSICDSLERYFPERQLRKFADSFEMSFIVTKYNTMPSILFETGYATTPGDAELILNSDWRDKLTDSLAEGIVDYFELKNE
ncbi:MAG: N-acetylmuramoyl-L-alanine amidase [Clostridia bacterium]|nr:N-acetylmuramoyl-L-alanine amidase [Clostridia bacterium]